jgi:hypothetical protein
MDVDGYEVKQEKDEKCDAEEGGDHFNNLDSSKHR